MASTSMATNNKRDCDGEMVANDDIKFELEKTEKSTLYGVVTKFMNATYIHIRKYYKNKPTRFGVCFTVEDWYKFVPYLGDDSSNKGTFGKIEGRRSSNGTLILKSIKSDMELYVKRLAMDSLLFRYV